MTLHDGLCTEPVCSGGVRGQPQLWFFRCCQLQYGDSVSHWPGALLGQAGRPYEPLPVFAFSALGLKVLKVCAVKSSYFSIGLVINELWASVHASQILCQLNYHPSPHFFLCFFTSPHLVMDIPSPCWEEFSFQLGVA